VITIYNEGTAYLEKRSGEWIHSQRYTSTSVAELLTRPYGDLRNDYRQINLPVIDWDGSKKSIELFDHLGRNMVAIDSSLTLEEAFQLIKNEVFRLDSLIVGIKSGFSRYVSYIHDAFEARGVKEGVHPSQHILEEDATDILLKNREGFDNPNLLWAVGGYFYYNFKIGPNYYLPYAAVYNGGVEEGVQLSALDMSEIDCDQPTRLNSLVVITDEGEVSIKYPKSGYSGMLLFIGGKPVLDMKNDKDIVFTTESLKLPREKLFITTSHLTQFCMDFGYDSITLRELIDHPTSFAVPYRGDLAIHFKPIKNEINSNGFILTEFLDYEGEFMIDSEGQLVPFLFMSADNQKNKKEGTLTFLGHRYTNDLVTTDYQKVEGLWDTSFKPFNDANRGLAHRQRKPHFSLVQFEGFKNFIREGDD
jgi:hypothetical protein